MLSEALRDLTLQELEEKERLLRKELFNLRFQAAVGHIENPNRFKEVRKDIARVLTLARMKRSQDLSEKK